MKKGLDDFKKSSTEQNSRTPYNYEEYCKKFKFNKNKKHKEVKILSTSIFCVLAIIIIYCLGSNFSAKSNNVEDLVIKPEEEEMVVLSDAWDKGVGLQLNDIKINGDELTIKLTLDYKNLDESILSNTEEKVEIATKGYLEVFEGDKKMKTFSPSTESTFLEDETKMTVKVKLPEEELINKKMKLKYVCKRLDVISSQKDKNKIIEGDWGITYNINELSDIEQGNALPIDKSVSIVNNDINVDIDFDYIVYNNQNVDLAYRYGKKRRGKT